jgi:integrase
MNILTIKQFDNELLPLLKEKYHIPATLQRKSGMRAFETGLRTKNHNGGLKPEELDFEKRTIILIGKQDKKREIPTKIDMKLVEEHYNQKKIPTYSAYHRAVKNAFKEIEHKPWSPRKYSMVTHCFRAYFIIDWIMEFGTTVYDLQNLIGLTGHKSIKELQPYLNAIGTESGIKKYHERF